MLLASQVQPNELSVLDGLAEPIGVQEKVEKHCCVRVLKEEPQQCLGKNWCL
jgi:hypothetical protein